MRKGKLEVVVYDNENDDLTAALGISNNRADELIKKAAEIWNQGKKVSEAFNEISNLVENVNELAFVFYALGRNVELNNPDNKQ